MQNDSWICQTFIYSKKKESINSKKIGFWDFWSNDESALNKGKSSVPHLYNDPEMPSSAFCKAKLFVTNLSMKSNIDYSGISLPVCSYRTNQKLHNISATPSLVEKVITNLD